MASLSLGCILHPLLFLLFSGSASCFTISSSIWKAEGLCRDFLFPFIISSLATLP